MPAAEDLGGVWGPAELLQRYEAGERPRPTVVRHGGEEWDVGDYLTGGLEGLPEGSAWQLVSALLAERYDGTAATVELFGAAEWEDDRTLTDAALTLLLDGGGRDALPVSRLRRTPLGRSGLRTLLAGAGIPAPVIGSLAGADARELLAALPSYGGEADAAAEAGGRSAAVQVVDACDGTEPADALRRLEAPRVPATVPTASARTALSRSTASPPRAPSRTGSPACSVPSAPSRTRSSPPVRPP